MAIERSAGVLILLLVILLVMAFFSGAGGVGIDTRSEYFFGDGPHSWRVAATEHRYQLTNGLTALALASVVAVTVAALLYWTLKSHALGLATVGTSALLVAGVLILVFVGLSLRTADLASSWIESPAGSEAGRIAHVALTTLAIRFIVGMIGFPLLLGSLILDFPDRPKW